MTYKITRPEDSEEGKYKELGAIHKKVISKLNLSDKDLEETNGKKSKTHWVEGPDGSMHTVYSYEGKIRVRPVGKNAAGATKRFIKHLDEEFVWEETMDYVELFQTQTKEQVAQLIKDTLDTRALDALEDIQKEFVSEVSKATLGSYRTKAILDNDKKNSDLSHKNFDPTKDYKKINQEYKTRENSIKKATEKIMKEESEE